MPVPALELHTPPGKSGTAVSRDTQNASEPAGSPASLAPGEGG
jgi:hypothetical protein